MKDRFGGAFIGIGSSVGGASTPAGRRATLVELSFVLSFVDSIMREACQSAGRSSVDMGAVSESQHAAGQRPRTTYGVCMSPLLLSRAEDEGGSARYVNM